MKHHLIILLLLTITTPLLAQSQLLHFDKTRCQILETTKQKPQNFPFVYSNNSVNDFCLNYLNSNKTDPNAEITIWKKVAKIHQLVRKQKLTFPIAFPILETGSYILISNDAIKPLLLEIEMTNSNIQTKIFYNCTVHY